MQSALKCFSAIQKQSEGKTPVIFLDYDGTLTPIVSHPDIAHLSDSMREVIRSLKSRYYVAIISGRGLEDIQKRVGLEGIYYSGNHGFEIEDPDGLKMELPEAIEAIPILQEIARELEKLIEPFKGAHIERKRFSVAVHYRNLVEQKQVLVAKVEKLATNFPKLKLQPGKQALNFGPNLDWDKGRATQWILDQISLSNPFPIFIGDDVTDEDAFKALSKKGVGILVSEEERATCAAYILKNPEEVENFLRKLLKLPLTK